MRDIEWKYQLYLAMMVEKNRKVVLKGKTGEKEREGKERGREGGNEGGNEGNGREREGNEINEEDIMKEIKEINVVNVLKSQWEPICEDALRTTVYFTKPLVEGIEI